MYEEVHTTYIIYLRTTIRKSYRKYYFLIGSHNKNVRSFIAWIKN